MDPSIFKQIEKKTGVSMDELMNLVSTIQYANFSDEKQVRKIVQKVSRLANKPISSKLEKEIVQSIVNDGQQLSFDKIEKMLKK
jgi:hypothetical protein